ncbi:acetylornithine transaminase [Schaalia suimastitidis]|uniref:acetylornithine transaminase n=1 Tax=Schaalia suimastitidis TaxID=121163 RepID=UPI00047C0B7B|nr:acetylornithine transaminase [Schaalia suimastitidis]
MSTITDSPKGWSARYDNTFMPTFGTPSLMLVRGDGTHVWDSEGNKYLDLYAGIAVNALGHAHPAIVDAVSQQITTLGHISNFFASIPQVTLGEHLLAITAPDTPVSGKVFLTNSGTESTEAALKIVKAYANTADTPKTRILALDHSFHGRSTGALALTWKESYRAPFAPLLGPIEFIPANDETALRDAMSDDVAAIFIEPIQGEAGVHVIHDSYMRLVRELTTRYGALMVIDEVQTGLGRTGQWMGHHWSAITPDVVTLAKGLAGGMPIGACIAYGQAAQILGPGMHGSTFGGNPVCAAAALAVINTIKQTDLVKRSRDLGARWRADLSQYLGTSLREVRGRGLLIGIELAEPVAPAMVTAARRNGFLLNATSETTLRLAPALTITDEQVDIFTQALPTLYDAARKENNAK